MVVAAREGDMVWEVVVAAAAAVLLLLSPLEVRQLHGRACMMMFPSQIPRQDLVVDFLAARVRALLTLSMLLLSTPLRDPRMLGSRVPTTEVVVEEASAVSILTRDRRARIDGNVLVKEITTIPILTGDSRAMTKGNVGVRGDVVEGMGKNDWGMESVILSIFLATVLL